jgi:hypothetical protein
MLLLKFATTTPVSYIKLCYSRQEYPVSLHLVLR